MYKKCEEILNKLQSEGKIKISNYQFPKPQELKLKLKDMLEDEVDEKYYISDGILNNIIAENQAGYLSGGKWDKINESCRRYYKEEGISPTIHTCQGGNTEPKVLIKDATKQGYKEAYEGDGVNISSRMKYQRGNVQKESIQTLTTSGGNDRGVVLNNLRIRKLTPCECWLLMGFDKVDFKKAEAINSNTQLYKQAGNSIVVNVLEAILTNLLLGGDK